MNKNKIEKKSAFGSFVAKASAPALAAGLGMVGIPQMANAAIVYTDVVPDFVGTTTYGVYPGSSYDLDLNNDDVTDFTIYNSAEAVSIGADYYYGPDNRILTSNGWEATMLNSGDIIDGSQTIWNNYADLAFDTAGFVGLKLAGSEYFGWVQLSVTDDSVDNDHIISFTVLDYAYETEDGVPILAGDTGPAVPIPGSLMLLASGAAAVGAFRRKNRKK